jgi:hypothetical protein
MGMFDRDVGRGVWQLWVLVGFKLSCSGGLALYVRRRPRRFGEKRTGILGVLGWLCCVGGGYCYGLGGPTRRQRVEAVELLWHGGRVDPLADAAIRRINGARHHTTTAATGASGQMQHGPDLEGAKTVHMRKPPSAQQPLHTPKSVNTAAGFCPSDGIARHDLQVMKS